MAESAHRRLCRTALLGLRDPNGPFAFARRFCIGLFANANRAENIATARALLGADPPAADPQQHPDLTPDAPRALRSTCPHCGARMIVIEVFARGCEPRWPPTPTASDTS